MKLIIANWKMQLDIRESVALTHRLMQGLPFAHELVLCPSFTAIAPLHELLMGHSIRLGGQDLFWEEKGAYTGEISAKQLHEIGCSFVLVGHSERRKNLKETEAMINKKMIAALSGKLVPILCVGEAYKKQLTAGLADLHLRHQESIVIAYEPEGSIGKKAAPLSSVLKAHAVMRELTRKLLPGLKSKQLRVIYGGGMEEKLAPAFLAEAQIDGLLVGGASLTMRTFAPILR